MAKRGKLTDRQERFCSEYVVDMNATKAAIRAGYSKKTARSQAQRLLTNVDISERVSELAGEVQREVGLDAQRVLAEAQSIAFFDPADVFTDRGTLLPLSEMPKAARRAIAGIDFHTEGRGEDAVPVCRLKFHSKLASLDLLAKHLGLFKESEDGSKAAPPNITIQVVDPRDSK